jgi:dGTPase
MQELEVIQKAEATITERYGALPEQHSAFRPQLARSVIHVLISDIIETTQKNLKKYKIRSVHDVYAKATPIANYSEAMLEQTLALRQYLYKNFYSSRQVRKYTDEGRELLKEIFTRIYENPMHLPERIRRLIDKPDPKAIVVKDYVAGMTDNFARDMVMKLRRRLI